MNNIKNQTVKKIGKINYIVTSASTENAKETRKNKIERLIKKDIEKMAFNEKKQA